MLYRYKAVGKNGTLLKGTLEASSSSDLKAKIRSLDLSLISYSVDLSFLVSQKIKRRTLLDFCLHLEQFEKAGIPLKESLEELSKTQPISKFQKILRDILNDVKRGYLFSQALAKHPSTFDPLFIGLITAGEKTGQFSPVLNQLYHHLKWVDEIQSQTFKAVRYPFIMVGILICMILFLMTTLIPELAIFLDNFSGNLPFSTRILIACSKFISDSFFYVLGFLASFLIILIIFFKFYPTNLGGKDHFLEHLPFIGSLHRKMAITHFCHIFTLLFASGIDILQALHITRSSSSKGNIYTSLEKVETFVREGLSLSQAFQRAKLFSPIVIHMVKMGEQTSSLQKTLLQAQDYLDTTLKRQIDHMVSLIEPSLILSIGLITGWIVYSIFLPLYDTLSLLDT